MTLKTRAEQLGIPFEVFPAHYEYPGARTTTRTTMEESKAWDEQERSRRLEALTVLEETAQRSMARCQKFLDYIQSRPHDSVAAAAHAYAGHLWGQPGITKATTVRTYMDLAMEPWPSQRGRQARWRKVTDGMECVAPVLDTGAEAEVQQHEEAETEGRMQPEEWQDPDELVLALAIRTRGLRAREVTRMMSTPGRVSKEDGYLFFRDIAEGRLNRKGRRAVAPRPIPLNKWQTEVLRSVSFPRYKSEQDWNELRTRVSKRVRELDGVSTIRVHRKLVARRIQEETVAATGNEAEGLAAARRALAHVEGSRSTFRYARVESKAAMKRGTLALTRTKTTWGTRVSNAMK